MLDYFGYLFQRKRAYVFKHRVNAIYNDAFLVFTRCVIADRSRVFVIRSSASYAASCTRAASLRAEFIDLSSVADVYSLISSTVT